MRKEILVTVAVLSLFTPEGMRAQAQRDAGVEIEVRSVRAVPQVYVGLQLRASREVFLPYCAEFESGERVLCTIAAHLEVRTAQGWHRAKLRTTYGVLGGLSLDRAKGTLLAPGTVASFSFQFSRRFFEVEPGQQLRVAVDTWADEQSMKTGGQSMQLVSEPFKCPQIGIGQ